MGVPPALAVAIIKELDQGLIVVDDMSRIIYYNDLAADKVDHICRDNFLNDLQTGTAESFQEQQQVINGISFNIKWKKLLFGNKVFFTALITLCRDNRLFKSGFDQLGTIIDTVNDGVIALNADSVITVYNKTLEDLEGIPRSEAVGKEFKQVYKYYTTNSSRLLNVLKNGRPLLNINDTYVTNNGSIISLVSNTYPFYENGRIVGSYSICKNITKVRDMLDSTMRIQQKFGQPKYFNISAIAGSVNYTLNDIIGNSTAIKKAVSEAEKAATSNSPVLIVGDTGTGKELFVQGIHERSALKLKPFVPINCAAIPENLLESMLFGTAKGAFTGAEETTGLFQQAEDGTLLLDEINSMGTNLQAKLLRVIQENMVRKVGGKKELPVKCRVISTINTEPQICIDYGSLRRDLFYRLAVLTIYIPPLSERIEDLELLIHFFISKFNKKYITGVKNISPDLMDIFFDYTWPGNVRELEHLIEGAITMMDHEKTIKLEHLPSYFYKYFSKKSATLTNISGTLSKTLWETEERTILSTLSSYNGNVTKSANALGISRQNLNYRIRKFGINVGKIRSS